MRTRVLNGIADADLRVLDELADSADNLVDKDIVDAKVDLNSLVKVVTVLFVVQVVPPLLSLTLSLWSDMSIRTVFARDPGLLLYSRILTIWEKFSLARS